MISLMIMMLYVLSWCHLLSWTSLKTKATSQQTVSRSGFLASLPNRGANVQENGRALSGGFLG